MEDSAAVGRPPPPQQHGGDAEAFAAAAAAAPLLSSSPHPPRASLGLETPRDEPEEEDLSTARRCLYASHFLSAWGARAWEFAAGLALFFPAAGGGAGKGGKSGENDGASLSLVAALGLAQQAAQALSGPYLGRLVDRLPRLAAARRAYGLQAAGTLASALFVLLARSAAAGRGGGTFFLPASPRFVYLLGSLAALFAALAAVGASGATLSVEREWTQALAKGGGRSRARGERGSIASSRLSFSSDGGGGGEKVAAAEDENDAPSSPSSLLASINAAMRRIDLVCLLASPGVAGLLLSKAGTDAAVAVIATYSCCAWVPQAWLLKRAVHAAPSRLREREGERDRRTAAAAAEETEEEQGEGEEETAPSPAPSSPPSPLAAYLSAEAFPSALALALLYLTVLSFGPLATAYLNWRGLGEVELAAWRGVGAAAGIAATAAFPRIRSGLGSDAAGALGIGSQFLCLLVGCLAAFLPPSLSSFAAVSPPRSSSSSSSSSAAAAAAVGGKGGSSGPGGARLLAASLALSRFGLWLFDLFASQNLQERVPRGQLGAVNGVQSTLQASLGALSFAAGLVISKPSSFWVLAVGSLGAVSLALVVCVSGQVVMRRRERRRAERERAARREIAAAAAEATA